MPPRRSGSPGPGYDTRHIRYRELRLREFGYRVIAGVDEAGRGALAGPVVAAAVVIPCEITIPGVHDSKAMTAQERLARYEEIVEAAEAWGVGIIEALRIDRVNILRATDEAMAQALAALEPPADFALVDGRPVRGLGTRHQAIVKGDQEVFLIAAASVVAKVTRDRIMADLDAEHPGYGFADHKGYGTRSHREAIRRLGPCPVHRRSFAPVADALHPLLPHLETGPSDQE
jgi:ribonuclease HII